MRKSLTVVLTLLSVLLLAAMVRSYFALDQVVRREKGYTFSVEAALGQIAFTYADLTGASLKGTAEPVFVWSRKPESVVRPDTNYGQKFTIAGFAWVKRQHSTLHPFTRKPWLYGPVVTQVVIPYWFVIVVAGAWPLWELVQHLRSRRRGFPVLPTQGEAASPNDETTRQPLPL